MIYNNKNIEFIPTSNVFYASKLQYYVKDCYLRKYKESKKKKMPLLTHVLASA